MYKIIGGDGQEYGPVTDADMRQWIAEGRLNGQSLAKAEGDAEFRPLSTFPEFAGALGTAAAAFGVPAAPVAATDWSTRDYDLDIGGCISRGWNLFTNNLGILLGSSVLFFVLILAASFAVDFTITTIVNAAFPMETRLSSTFQIIQSYVIQIVMGLAIGPLMGGLFYIFIQTMRGGQAGVNDLFIGFQRAFSQLFLGSVITTLVRSLCFLPAAIIVMPRMVPLLVQMTQLQRSGLPPAQTQGKMLEILSQFGPIFGNAMPIYLVCLVPWFYLLVNLEFTLPLIIDKQMDFWTAMKTSWRMVHKHWLTVFGLSFLSIIIFLAGSLLCCCGLPFTFVISTAAIIIAYETIFGERPV